MVDYSNLSAEERERRANELKRVRKNLPKSPGGKAKFIADKIALTKYLNPFIDWLYGIALSAALLKDILDLVALGSLPGIGTVITLMATITIWAVMIITGNAFHAYKKRRLIIRYGVLIVGTLIEMVFGLDFIPVETAMVVYIYVSVLQDRREATMAEQEAKKQY